MFWEKGWAVNGWVYIRANIGVFQYMTKGTLYFAFSLTTLLKNK